MTHNTRILAIGLALAWISGHVVRVMVTEVEWFAPLAPLTSMITVMILLRWLIGKVD